jgi:hypothetical protein
VERPTHSRVVITMPPPRKTHLEALIEKAPVESKGFFFVERTHLVGPQRSFGLTR